MGGEVGDGRGRDGGKPLVRGLYGIVDTSLVPAGRVAAVAEQLIEGGVKILQLRAKGLAGGEFLALARTLKALALKNRVLFIVNDRVDIAMAVGAAGVHLGQDDIPVHEARALLGERFIIGLSTHNLREAELAEGSTADYVSFGPIFTTSTKKNAEPPLGLKALGKGRTLVRKPLVAIGGITEESLPSVIGRGVDGVAIISDILLGKTPAEKVRSIRNIIKVCEAKV